MNSTASEALSRGLAAHRAGRLEEARRLYESALSASPNNPDALHLYGVLLGALGDSTRGAAMLRRAIALQPKFAAAHFNLGCLLQRSGANDQAETAFRNALTIQPVFSEALLNLGNLLLMRGAARDSVGFLSRAVAINPALSAAHHSLGLAHEAAGDIVESIASFTAEATLANGTSDALVALADRLLARGDATHAADAYRRALSLTPNRSDLHCNLGNALRLLGALVDAEAAYRASLALNPASAPVLNNLGIVLQEQGHVDEAIDAFNRACVADPGYAEAPNSLAPALQLRGRLDEAAEACLAALRLEPRKADAHCNLGNVRLAQNRLNDAIAEFRTALEIDPSNASYAKNLSYSLLTAGHFGEAWPLFDARWNATMKKAVRPFQSRPRWSGAEPIDGRTFFVHSEQGLGDTLQFMRYVPLLAARGASVVFEVQSALVDLLHDFDGAQRVIARGDPIPEFDLHCPLLSLPAALGTDLATIPAKVPYLRADPARVESWTGRLAGLPASARIGVVWAGNPNHGNDHNRSIPFAAFRTILNHPGVTFISLQKEIRASELDAVSAQSFPFDPGVELHSFADTAALVSALDAVITVDTSIAHLAGALGKPTWILLPFAPDWRWMLERPDTPWYPTARLYRQPRPGDWTTPLAAVREALDGLVQGKQGCA